MDFPFRKQYMPPFVEMFRRLAEIATDPPRTWATKNAQNGCELGIVERTFPGDYEHTDSISDHFGEHVRIKCNEHGHVSPLQAWSIIKKTTLDIMTKPIRERREAVYEMVRGCNIFNAAFATYIFTHFTKPGASMLDCTAGWGDRLIAAHASPNISLYMGWDTNPELQAVYAAAGKACVDSGLMQRKLQWSIKCAPFESAASAFDARRHGDLCEKFDLVMVAPPFFTKEMYLGPKTSTTLYKTLTDWNRGFYVPTLMQGQAALKPNGHMLLYVTHAMFQLARKTLAQMTHIGNLGFKQVVQGHDTNIRMLYCLRKGA